MHHAVAADLHRLLTPGATPHALLPPDRQAGDLRGRKQGQAVKDIEQVLGSFLEGLQRVAGQSGIRFVDPDQPGEEDLLEEDQLPLH